MLKEFNDSHCPYCGCSELESLVFYGDCSIALDRILILPLEQVRGEETAPILFVSPDGFQRLLGSLA